MNRTRIVRWLRVLLPLVALVILSTMFLFSNRPGDGTGLSPAHEGAEQTARDHRILLPHYSTMTGDGAEISLRAAEAMPGRDTQDPTASDLLLDWRAKSGLSARLIAPDGTLGDDMIELRGGVRMTTSSGWQVEAPSVDAAMDKSWMLADEGVEAEAPFGHLTADRMHMQPDERFETGPDAPSVLNFTGNVHLIYQP
ncbi:hypothetical protein [Paracoccus sp. (in: a-proteobacteria)]|uniref:hypothetical protein n=1 Tax=Paracoccus sp. TaxID=267 RepID=UPI003A8A97F6